MTELDILYRDKALIAINKPSGLLVHRSKIDRRETRFALQMLRDQIGQHVFPLHRLDKPTSGVLLFALSAETARLAQPLFRDHHAQKEYLAVVRGWTEDQDHIDYALKEELDALTDGNADLDKEAQSAVTDYRTLARTELPHPVGRYASARYSLLQVTPRTGRRHQIRRHFKHLFHPVIGDTTHGDSRHNRFFRQHFDCHRLLLHAWQIRLPHPIDGTPVTITAPVDCCWQTMLELFATNPFDSPALIDNNKEGLNYE